MRFAYGEICDDAMITFTYARNLVEGHGLVFNAGEYVYGTTAPLWGLFVALGMKLHVNPWTWTMCWDVVFGGVILLRLCEILHAANMKNYFPITAAAIVFASGGTWHYAGMETGLYDILIFSTIAALVGNRRPWVAVAWGSLAAALRPDGVIVLAVALGYCLARCLRSGDRRGFALCMVPLLVPAVHTLAAAWYFGSPIPESMVAKYLTTVHAEPRYKFGYDLLRRVAFNHDAPNPAGWMAVVGLAVQLREGALRPLAVFASAYALLFAAGGAPCFAWYFTPLAIAACVFLPVGVVASVRLCTGLLRHLPPIVVPSVPPAVSWSVVALMLVLPQYRGTMAQHADALVELGPDLTHRDYRTIASMIRRESRGMPRVATAEIGYLGYFLEGYTYDLSGLVTPEIVQGFVKGEDPLPGADVEWYVWPVLDPDPPSIRAFAVDRPRAAGFEAHSEWRWGVGTTYVSRKPAPPPG